MEPPAFARDGRLRRLDQVLQSLLLREAINKLPRRNDVLGLDESPDPPLIGSKLGRPSGVQVSDYIRKACDGADLLGRLPLEREVMVGEPCARNRFFATDDRVEGAEKADE